MSLKITVSYTEDPEAKVIMELLKPIQSLFKIKKNTGSRYKHIYYIQKS